jgi:hypothetical protein
MPLARGLVFLAAILAGLALLTRHRSHHGPLEFGIWYWHSPFLITEQDRELLGEAGIGTDYVRTGTFTTDGKRVLLVLPQTWRSKPSGLKIVEVFNFDPGLLRHFGEFSVDSMAGDVTKRIAKAVGESRATGIEPSGIQLDIDCPTRLLPKYAQLLKAVRNGLANSLPGKWSFSVTALPTWLSSSKFDLVAKEVDFVVPQFYENRVGRTLDTVKPVSDPVEVRTGLERLDRIGTPFFAGLPAYGHAMLFDRFGRLASMYPGLSAEDVLRHPSLQFQSTRPIDADGAVAREADYVGEDLLIVKAARADSNGHGKGDSIAYLLPSAEMVKRQLAIVDNEASEDCRGVIFYRFPELAETTSLPLESLVAALRKLPEKLDFEATPHAHAVPYALIGSKSAASLVPRELSVVVTATGNVATESQPDALTVLIQFDRPGIGELALGDFDSVDVGEVINGVFAKTGRARANAVLLRRSNALPGQKLKSGDIELLADGPTTVRIAWTAHGMGGYRTAKGSSPTRKLAELTK